MHPRNVLRFAKNMEQGMHPQIFLLWAKNKEKMMQLLDSALILHPPTRFIIHANYNTVIAVPQC